jgi:hypothetical protein
MGTWYLVTSQGVKTTGHHVDHLPPSRAEFKNEWRYTSVPSIRLQVVDREKVTFTFIRPLPIPIGAIPLYLFMRMDNRPSSL